MRGQRSRGCSSSDWSNIAFAPQFALKPVERREDETRQLGVFSKKETGDRHHLTTSSGAHAGNHQ